MKKVYSQTRILLILSQVDETFCRVAYEGLLNKLPMITTDYGNLPHLLRGSADILSDNADDWVKRINRLYDDSNKLQELSNGIVNKICPQSVMNKFYKTVTETIDRYNSKIRHNSIGILGVFGDQGIGIQCREYYIHLRELGWNVSIFSFKPYKSDICHRLQTDISEWDYPNIWYSDCVREDISPEEFIDYLHTYNISTFIIIEVCYHKVFELARICRMLGIKVYCIPNIEIIRASELNNLMIFDKVLANNIFTQRRLSEYLPNNLIHYLGFRFSNTFYNLSLDIDSTSGSKTFFCCGGLNAFTRKNINLIIDAFRSLNPKSFNCFKLHVYIQDTVDQATHGHYLVPHENITYHIGSLPYKTISKLYSEHTIFIHFGGHEGLGLGFYESMASGCPVLTIDTPPNNEIILEGINGWLLSCTHDVMLDNPDGIVKRAIINVDTIRQKMQFIIDTYNPKIRTSTINHYIISHSKADYQHRLKTLL